MTRLATVPETTEVTKAEAYETRISEVVTKLEAVTYPILEEREKFVEDADKIQYEARLKLLDIIVDFVVDRISEDPENHDHFKEVLKWLKTAISKGIDNRHRMYSNRPEVFQHLYDSIIERLSWQLSQKEIKNLEATPSIEELSTQIDAIRTDVRERAIRKMPRYR